MSGAPAPGIGLPWGQVSGLSSLARISSSTSAEITCSQRQASMWARCQGSPNRSVSRRSARRWRRTIVVAQSRPFSSQGEGAVAVDLEVALGPETADHLGDGRSRDPQSVSQAGLDDARAFLLEFEDGF